jgi:hypothetical protein
MSPDQHMFQSVMTRYGSYPLCGETALCSQVPVRNSPRFFRWDHSWPRASVACCNRIIRTSRVCRTEREPATLATPMALNTGQGQASSSDPRAVVVAPTPLASTGFGPRAFRSRTRSWTPRRWHRPGKPPGKDHSRCSSPYRCHSRLRAACRRFAIVIACRANRSHSLQAMQRS